MSLYVYALCNALLYVHVCVNNAAVQCTVLLYGVPISIYAYTSAPKTPPKHTHLVCKEGLRDQHTSFIPYNPAQLHTGDYENIRWERRYVAIHRCRGAQQPRGNHDHNKNIHPGCRLFIAHDNTHNSSHHNTTHNPPSVYLLIKDIVAQGFIGIPVDNCPLINSQHKLLGRWWICKAI